ncbi:MAG: two-component regulator propeller domain-containing protein, partial [Bacteroidota bacterium]
MKRPTLCWLSTRYALTVLAVGLASCTAPEPAPDSLDAAPADGLVTPARSVMPPVSRIAPRFETLQMADGLVSSEANVFMQDRQGFLWIGTFNGLSRYDGASFQNYLHDPADSTSLGHNAINWLHQDRAGAIWIGTNGGLGRFDPATETFQHLRHDPEDPASLGHNIVRGLAEGRDGAIWAGTRGGGLNRLDPATGTFTRVPRPAAQLGLERTSANTVHAVLANPDGTLWVGGTDGLARYDPSNSRFDIVHRDPSDPTSALLPAVSCLVRDHTGALWAGTTF